jgi:hypothetical protein
MRTRTFIAAVAVGIAAMVTTATSAQADAVTATVCREGGGVVHSNPTFPHLCIGGRYDGAEVWSH